MTTSCIASAPGKAVLSGEYAVLDGAPAICMALDARARATVSMGGSAGNTIMAPGFSEQLGHFDVKADAIQWLPGSARFELFESVWRAMDIELADSLSIELNTAAFSDPASGTKFGIGSSAALTVALVAALDELTAANRGTVAAHRAHSSLQGGRGSGVDIACSATGGLIHYRRENEQTSSIEWPQNLLYRLVWTGFATSTSAQLAHLDVSASRPSRERLMQAAEDLALAWCGGDADEIVDTYRAYIPILRTFGDDHGLRIFAAGHESLWHAADSLGLVYKPCGAGGGDVGIVLGSDNDKLDEFVNALQTPCILLNHALDLHGTRIDENKTND